MGASSEQLDRTAAGGVVNAMSIDVEDYFHVSVFDGIVPRNEWDRMQSRVVANTNRILDLFDEYSVRSTFFVLGWVAERHPTEIDPTPVVRPAFAKKLMKAARPGGTGVVDGHGALGSAGRVPWQ